MTEGTYHRLVIEQQPYTACIGIEQQKNQKTPPADNLASQ